MALSIQPALAVNGMRSSMGRMRDCRDSAPYENPWGRLNIGGWHRRRFTTRRQAMADVIDWQAHYKHRRRHATLGYLRPRQFEEGGARHRPTRPRDKRAKSCGTQRRRTCRRMASSR
jgi:transposase InsO family protein